VRAISTAIGGDPSRGHGVDAVRDPVHKVPVVLDQQHRVHTMAAGRITADGR
jgi:hypothetical protein